MKKSYTNGGVGSNGPQRLEMLFLYHFLLELGETFRICEENTAVYNDIKFSNFLI